ncbi:MAG: DUF4870 domain-containing protein [Candidatus Omnitrophica bacterium]|nr:DUF4870 domain-containing protein [Candidatus Omnitrophota bacterium]
MTDGNSSLDPNLPRVELNLSQERNWAMFCHLSALTCFIGIPFGNIFAPLIIWFVKRRGMSLVDREGRKALNFQISMTIYALIAAILCFFLVGFLLIIPLIVADIIITIVAAVKTKKAKDFEYPFAIRFFKPLQ